MWVMDDIVVPLVLIIGVSCFVWLARAKARAATRKSMKTAESMYDNNADSLPRQRRYAQAHGGTWRDDSSPATVARPARTKAP